MGVNKFSLKSPPPSAHLKKILSTYPEGSQIFKEALQNADDALASSFYIILDERTNSCSSEELSRFMGPSLIFLNNSIFTDNDWLSLQNMFESFKINNPGSIGRFGMGSRSYFHVTDLLCVLSGDQFAFLDPDWILTSDGGASGSLQSLNNTMISSSECDNLNIKYLKILFDPIKKFLGVDESVDFFNGTLFRLPLRNGCWAKNSSFAPYEYSCTKIFNILERFKEEVVNCLLFIQSVDQLEIWRWKESEKYPYLLYSANVKQEEYFPEEKLYKILPARKSRMKIRNFLIEQTKYGSELKSLLTKPDTGNFPETETCYIIEENDYTENSSHILFDDCLHIKSTISQWYINIRIVSHSDLIKSLQYTKCAPVVGIALLRSPFQINETKGNKIRIVNIFSKFNLKFIDSDSTLAEDCVTKENNVMKLNTELNSDYALYEFLKNFENTLNFRGQLFSYLPLSDVLTGLPVHIHGTFQLTDNRRSLWMSSDDTDGQANYWINWNTTLLFYAIPQLYIRVMIRFMQWTLRQLALLYVKLNNGSMDDESGYINSRNIINNYYRAWPNENKITTAFRNILKEFVRYAKNEKLIIREPQSYRQTYKRLASVEANIRQLRTNTINTQKDEYNMMPPFKPLESIFLYMNDTERYIIAKKKNLIHEVIGQSQLLGHSTVYVPDWVLNLFNDIEPGISQGLRSATNTNNKNENMSNDSRSNNSPNWFNESKKINKLHLLSFFDLFSKILLPYWSDLPHRELPHIPYFTDIMLLVCRILGRGPDKYILRLRHICSSLPFIPIKYPGIDYDEFEPVPLKAPNECYDPIIHTVSVIRVFQPDGDFRSPDVLRVLRLWGLRQTLGWVEVAREAVGKMCMIQECNPNHRISELFH